MMIPVLQPFRRKVLTLVFIVRTGSAAHDGRKVLLGLKKRGFGMGKWNGFGGKVEPLDANIAAAAVREVKEEVNVHVNVDDLESCGVLLFSFEEEKEKVLEVHVFRTHEVSGDPVESDEMRPQWYDISQIPFTSMWAGDRFWVPHVLSGRSVKGHFHFAHEDTLLDYELEVSPTTALNVKNNQQQT